MKTPCSLIRKRFMIAAMLLAIGIFSGCESDSSSSSATSDTTAFAGTYSGTFSGDDLGTWSFSVDTTGNVDGEIFSAVDADYRLLSGSLDSEGDLIAGLYLNNSYYGTYVGTVTTNGAAAGKWTYSDGGFSGHFAGSKQ